MNKLGFGFLRLPKVNEEIDYTELNRMVDAFLAGERTYFDMWTSASCIAWMKMKTSTSFVRSVCWTI